MAGPRSRRHLPARRLAVLFILLPLVAGCHGIAVDSDLRLETYSDEPWREVLAGTVRDGMVDYRLLRDEHEPALNTYLDAIGRFGPRTNPDLFETSESRLAYYLNAYNALMLRKWLDAGAGVDTKPRSVSLLWFVVDSWRVDGRWTSLHTLEQGTIRREFVEPRIHFALVCGAVSCPPLAAEPFDPARLDEQLETLGRNWLRDEDDGLVIGPDGSARMSMIFMWYFEDFRAGGMMPGVLRRYLEPDDPRLEIALRELDAGEMEWLPYSWSINDVRINGPCASESSSPP